jgi:hypothetical protein
MKLRLVIVHSPATLTLILEGRRIAPGTSWGRKVRTPKGAMPRNPGEPTQEGSPTGYTREAMPRGIPTDSATEKKPPGLCWGCRPRHEGWALAPSKWFAAGGYQAGLGKGEKVG